MILVEPGFTLARTGAIVRSGGRLQLYKMPELPATRAFQNKKPRLGLREETIQLVRLPRCHLGFTWNNEEVYRTPTRRTCASRGSPIDNGTVCCVVLVVLTTVAGKPAAQIAATSCLRIYVPNYGDSLLNTPNLNLLPDR